MDKDKSATWHTPDSQRAYWRDSGSMPAETFVRICERVSRSNFGEPPPA